MTTLQELLRLRRGDESISSSGAGLIETGDLVEVSGKTAATLDNGSRGRRGVFRGISGTHGYAIVEGIDGKAPEAFLVHPESLVRKGPNPEIVAEAVDRLRAELAGRGINLETPPGPAPVPRRRRRVYASSLPLKGMKKLGSVAHLSNASKTALEKEFQNRKLDYRLTNFGSMLRGTLWVQTDRYEEASRIFWGYVR